MTVLWRRMMSKLHSSFLYFFFTDERNFFIPWKLAIGVKQIIVTSKPVLISRSWKNHKSTFNYLNWQLSREWWIDMTINNDKLSPATVHNGNSDDARPFNRVHRVSIGNDRLICNRFCRMTNCQPLRWLVDTPSRDVHHYRMMNVSAVDRATLQCCTVMWPCIIAI